MMCGGTGEQMPADADIQAMCDTVKANAEEKTKKVFEEFAAVNYKRQVVAGTNYFIKVHVGSGDHVHLRVFKALPHNGGEVALHSLLVNKTLEESLEHF